MPRKGRRSGESAHLPSAHVDRGYGHRSKGEAFDKARRDRFLTLLFEGASKLGACRLTPVAVSTVDRWVENGEANASDESIEFANYYYAALEYGNHENHKVVSSTKDPHVRLQILMKRDPRYGDLDLKRERQRVEIDNLREKHKVEMDAKHEDLQTRKHRNKLLEVTVAKAAQPDKEGTIAFGIAVILDPAFGLSESAQREIAARAVALGWIAVESGGQEAA
jgi:hypothetical protein